jgi:subtilisin family serine protease
VGAGLIDNINAGVKWAIDQGADVINMSLGVQYTGGGLPHEEVVEYARRKGVTIVAASGNDEQEALYYPGAFPRSSPSVPRTTTAASRRSRPTGGRCRSSRPAQT